MIFFILCLGLEIGLGSSGFHYSFCVHAVPVARSFFLGGHKKNKKRLIYFVMSRFLAYREKMHHLQGQKRSINCAYREKECKIIVVRMHIDYLFPIGKKNDWK